MAKCKRSSRRPQPKHKKNNKSQHDKRKRLERRNPKRKKTTHARVPLAGTIRTAVSLLQAAMDRRIAFRLALFRSFLFRASRVSAAEELPDPADPFAAGGEGEEHIDDSNDD